MELASCFRLTVAAVQLRGATTTIVEGSFKSISTPRVVWFVGVQLVRLAIAVLLAYGGVRFLMSTISLPELILNIVALEEGGHLF